MSDYDEPDIIKEAKDGNLKQVKQLLKDPKIVSLPSIHFAMEEAVKNSHLSIVKELLKHKEIVRRLENNWGLVHEAIRGKLEILKELLKNEEIVKLFIRNGINECISADNLNALKLLLKYKVVVNSILKIDIEDIVRANSINTLKELLKYRQFVSTFYEELLHLATVYGRLHMVQLLLKLNGKRKINIRGLLTDITDLIIDQMNYNPQLLQDQENNVTLENIYRCIHLLLSDFRIRVWLIKAKDIPVLLKTQLQM